MDTTVAKNIPPETKVWIMHAVREILEDPDFGLELSEHAKKRLRRMQGSKNLRRKSISSSEIILKYC